MKNILIGVKMDKREVRNSLNQLQQTMQKIKMTQTADKKKKKKFINMKGIRPTDR